MADTAILVIGGKDIISFLEESYIHKHTVWGNECASIRARFKQKTSRTIKNGKVYESTNWYEEQPTGGLKSVGKEKPDYSKYYPPEPKPVYSFGFNEYEGHVILEEKDYKANQALFKDCLAFRLEECVNFSHPLYKNPQKAIDSVRKAGVSSARSPGGVGQKRDPVCFGDDERCLGDGDCDNCEHNEECPVPAEQFCMRCGESFIGSISDHKCKQKLPVSEALAKINTANLSRFTHGCNVGGEE